jgi:hypothetical protein
MERDTELLRTLALVRPIGMSDDMATDWLAAALVELRDMSDGAFHAGCRHARQTCTHHGQIIPAVMAGAREASKPDPFRWALACHQPSQPVPALTDGRSGAKRLGDVVKQLGHE